METSFRSIIFASRLSEVFYSMFPALIIACAVPGAESHDPCIYPTVNCHCSNRAVLSCPFRPLSGDDTIPFDMNTKIMNDSRSARDEGLSMSNEEWDYTFRQCVNSFTLILGTQHLKIKGLGQEWRLIARFSFRVVGLGQCGLLRSKRYRICVANAVFARIRRR